ncbi:hypothetical protein GE061_013016 [Apolygus lucorum]|uniref:Uncharacterized protein n=1 Tax=Apolygus lucorum TaxID=248454 RepID=A0A8S9XU76_APOLU|nr:hypothetical protein GE061_013016 [Apolygus lucorum]
MPGMYRFLEPKNVPGRASKCKNASVLRAALRLGLKKRQRKEPSYSLPYRRQSEPAISYVSRAILSKIFSISATTDLQDLAEIELARVLSAEGWYQRELTFLANLSLNTLAAEANVQRKRHTGRHHHITAQNSSKKGHTSGESRTRNLSKQIEEKPTQEKEMKEPEMKDIYEIWSKPYGWLVLPGEKMPMVR